MIDDGQKWELWFQAVVDFVFDFLTQDEGFGEQFYHMSGVTKQFRDCGSWGPLPLGGEIVDQGPISMTVLAAQRFVQKRGPKQTPFTNSRGGGVKVESRS